MILTNPPASLTSKENLNLAIGAATKAARAGREILTHYFGRLKKVEEKFQAGLVSEADRESELAIFSVLKNLFPADEYLGEEGTGHSDQFKKPTQKSRWVVDPLDGTTNYIHGFPFFAISIALEVQGETQAALIDIPMMEETYIAMRGLGAWVNGVPLKTTKTTELKQGLVATGFFGDDDLILKEQLQIFSEIVRGCRAVRRAGSAAYDLCQVARGVFDAYWERNLKPWDTAAGILLVSEAGGRVTNYFGDDYSPYENSILATNTHLHPELLKRITPHLLIKK